MPSAELQVIAEEGERLLEQARRRPELIVPQYPEWTLVDLIVHTASIHGRTTILCRERAAARVRAPRLPEGAEPFGWYRQTLGEMLEVLAATDPATEVWSFAPGNQTAGFWMRRMVIETAMHRRDADQAHGEEGPLPEGVVRAAWEEFPEMWLQWLGELPPVRFHALDLVLVMALGSDTPAHLVEGTGSDIYLRLMQRPSPVRLPEEWQRAVDALIPPPHPTAR